MPPAGCNDTFIAVPIANARIDSAGEPLNLADIRNALKSLMWRNVGVRRNAEGLSEALQNVSHWCGYVLGRQFADPGGWELQNMLGVARLITTRPWPAKRVAGPTSARISPPRWMRPVGTGILVSGSSLRMAKSRRTTRLPRSVPASSAPLPSPPRLGRLQWRCDGAICAGLLLLIALAYWPVVHNQFVSYDDDGYIVENETSTAAFRCTASIGPSPPSSARPIGIR